MIQTASILWAAVPTGLCVLVYMGCEHQRRWKEYWAKEAEYCLAKWGEVEGRCDRWRCVAASLQDKIDRDAAKRSSITSRGNITRAANRRSKVLEQASKLVPAKALDIAA